MKTQTARDGRRRAIDRFESVEVEIIVYNRLTKKQAIEPMLLSGYVALQ